MINLLIKNYGTIFVFITLLSFLVSFAFYKFNKNSLSFAKKTLLIGLRTLMFTLIGILILNPKIEHTKQIIQKKKLIVLADNSSSMSSTNFDQRKLENFNESINVFFKDKLDVINYGFDQTITPYKSFNLKGKSTNLSSTLKAIQHQFETDEIHSVVLLSDGIFNQSFHPKWINPQPEFPIYSMGFGDTIQYPDLSVDYIKTNSISYLGNDFPLEIHIKTKAWNTTNVVLTVKDQHEKIVHQHTWSDLKRDDFIHYKTNLPAIQTGLNTYTVHLSSNTSEKNIKNNTKSFSIDVIDVKNKILLLASEIHPDHHAIHQSLKSNIDYDLEFISINDNNDIDLKLYDCIIFLGYQSETKSIVKESLDLKKNIIFKFNQVSNLKHLTQEFPNVFENNTSTLDWDLAQNSLNKHFNGFKLNDDLKTFLGNTPPLAVPFSQLKYKKTLQHILLQKVMNSTNKKGIISVSTKQDNRIGFIQGEGFWKWRVYDYKTNKNFQQFDEFMKSIVRLISVQKDKRLFHCIVPKTIIQDEKTTLNATLYNESYEVQTNEELLLSVKHKNGLEFSFPFITSGNSYEVNVILSEPGEYTYEINHVSKGNKRLSKGVFIVKKNELELQNTVANYNVLRYLSNETGGLFYSENNFIDLENQLKTIKTENNKIKVKQSKSITNFYWLLIILLCIALLEWYLRRLFSLQ